MLPERCRSTEAQSASEKRRRSGNLVHGHVATLDTLFLMLSPRADEWGTMYGDSSYVERQ